MNIPDTDLPPLPEKSYLGDDVSWGYEPYDMLDYARQAIAHWLKLHEGQIEAWRTFDGEGGYDLRNYEGNETYREDWIKRNGDKYASWVEPLFLAPQPQEVEAAVMAERGACAKFVTSSAVYGAVRGYGYMTSRQTAECLDSISAAIRARTTSPETRE
jgi:ABC-type cobalt transport system substrate-binding protein